MKRYGLALYTNTFESGLTIACDRGIGVEIQSFTDPEVISGDWDAVAAKYAEALEATPPAFLIFHAPYVDIAPLVRDPFVLEGVIKRMDWSFDMAGRFNAEGVVVHLSTALRRIDFNLDLWIDRQFHFWEPFVERAEREGFKIFFENTYEPDPAFLVLLHDRFASKAVQLCLDFGHAGTLCESTVEEWLLAGSHRIGYLHLHNNDGRDDLHASLGDGILDYSELLQRARNHVDRGATAVIEVDTVTDMVASLKYLDEICWGVTQSAEEF